MNSIRKNLGSGILFTALAKYSNVVLSVIVGAILARLLTPDEFGIVAIVTVFVSFFNILSDFGIGPAVVQNKTLDKEDIRSIFSFSIVIGISLSLLFFGSASVIADFYEQADLYNITRLLSLAIFFFSAQIVPRALLQKKLKFKEIGIITVITQIAGGIVAIVLAYLGFSYYALVFKSIWDSFSTLVIFYIMEPIEISLKFNYSSIKKILSFSIYQFLFNFINYFSRNSDNLLIGKFFSPSSLGFYEKSYRLMLMPVQNLTHVISPVLLPVLSNYQDDKEKIYNTYVKLFEVLAFVGFPLSVLLYFSAEEIIYIIFGNQWTDSIPVFKLLSLTVGIQIVLSTTGGIFQSLNKTKLMFYNGLFSAFFMVAGILYGIFIGEDLESVGIGLIIAFSINFLFCFYLLIHFALEHSFFKFLYSLLAPIFLSVIIWITFLYTKDLLNGNHFLVLTYKVFLSLLVSSLFFLISKSSREKILFIIKRK